MSASREVSRRGIARAYHFIDHIIDWIAVTVSCTLLSCTIYIKSFYIDMYNVFTHRMLDDLIKYYMFLSNVYTRTSMRSEETSYLLGVNRLCDHQYRVSLVCLHWEMTWHSWELLMNMIFTIGLWFRYAEWTRLRCSLEVPVSSGWATSELDSQLIFTIGLNDIWLFERCVAC